MSSMRSVLLFCLTLVWGGCVHVQPRTVERRPLRAVETPEHESSSRKDVDEDSSAAGQDSGDEAQAAVAREPTTGTADLQVAPNRPDYVQDAQRDNFQWLEALATECEQGLRLAGCSSFNCFPILNSYFAAAMSEYSAGAASYAYWFGAKNALEDQGVAKDDPMYQEVVDRIFAAADMLLAADKSSKQKFYDEVQKFRSAGPCQSVVAKHLVPAHERGDYLGLSLFVEYGDQFACVTGYTKATPAADRNRAQSRASIICSQARLSSIRDNAQRVRDIRRGLEQ